MHFQSSSHFPMPITLKLDKCLLISDTNEPLLTLIAYLHHSWHTIPSCQQIENNQFT